MRKPHTLMYGINERGKATQMQQGNNRLLLPQAAADRLNVRLHRFYELARQDRIPGVVRIGRQLRVRPDALESFIQTGGERDEG